MTPPLVRRKPEAWPRPMGWLKNDDGFRFTILERARADWALVEERPNRGPEIDRYLRRAHVPEELIEAGKGNWCAAIVGCWWIDAGALTPRDFGNCDAWLPYLVPCTLATIADVARPGDAVLFGDPTDARHIELVLRVTPLVLTTGGNRALKGGASNNGVAMHTDQLTRPDVIGIVRPVKADP